MSDAKYIEIYVKGTSNCPVGMPSTRWKQLSPEWTGERLTVFIPIKETTEENPNVYEVVGWTDLGGGSPTTVTVAHVRTIPEEEGEEEVEGYLVYGGNSGVRILDESVEPVKGVDDHLPRGTGEPTIFVLDLADLPQEVQDIVGNKRTIMPHMDDKDHPF